MSRVVYTNTADTIDQEPLRVAHGVRVVTAQEEGSPLNVLPGGVYGFTYSPGLPNAPLFATRRYRSYEVHKLAGGDIYIVAFADAENAALLETSAASQVSVHVHPEPSASANILVKVPYSRISHHRQYAAPNQEGFRVSVTGPV
jgi:hypothetical protein